VDQLLPPPEQFLNASI